ncbi:MAG: efflux RND transporter periplasmic adaptor subunit [Calditrichaceae bacterium]
MSTENTDLSSLRIDKSKRENHSDGPKTKKTHLWIIGILAVLVIILLYGKIAESPFSEAVEVRLAKASMQSPAQSEGVLTASGYVVAQRKAAVASKGTGRLVHLGVVEGDKVTKNQIIARLEDNDIMAQLNQAKATLKLEQAELNNAYAVYTRRKSLYESEAASKETYDVAEAEYRRVLARIDLAKAQLEAAEVAMENTLIRAPFDGTVLTKNADVGEIVAPLAAGVNSRAAVVTIADMSSLQVEADVSESNIQKITAGMECEITLDAYPNKRYAGFVAKIVPTADRAKATVMVKVGFKDYDTRVLPEMSAKVLFLKNGVIQTEANEQPVLVVPNTAVALRDGKQVVFTVKDEKAVEVAVVPGEKFAGYWEIKEGLRDGDLVINRVNDQIINGVKVLIQ